MCFALSLFPIFAEFDFFKRAGICALRATSHVVLPTWVTNLHYFLKVLDFLLAFLKVKPGFFLHAQGGIFFLSNPELGPFSFFSHPTFEDSVSQVGVGTGALRVKEPFHRF